MIRRKGRFSYAVPDEAAEPEVLAQRAQAAQVIEPKIEAGPRRTSSDPRQALQNPAAYALPPQRKGKREHDGVLKRTDVPREQLNVRIRPELKRAAAGLAGLQGMTLGDVVEAALIEYLEAARDDA